MRPMMCGVTVAIVIACSISLAAKAAEPNELIKTIKSIGKEGQNYQQATAAVRELSQADAASAIPVLKAIKGTNPLVSNWLQGAFEAIADRALANKTLQADSLEAFVINRDEDPRARRLAYEWLTQLDPQARERLIPNMLDDPSASLRRDAVAAAIVQAEQARDSQQALKLWQKALQGAADEDQVKTIAEQLKSLGEPVDLVHHFGFLTEWYLIGPFDNRETKGFNVVYPPENEIDLQAEYDGMKGPVRWKKYVTDKDMGTFDIAKLTEPHKGAVDYAYTEIQNDQTQPVEIRLATPNAWKLWLNGELLFAREEYHRGMRLDQYTVQGQLKPGTNSLLLKICQNEQTQDWAQKWAFQLRICDLTGQAIHPKPDKSAAAQ